MEDLAQALEAAKTEALIDGVVAGAIDSDYQRTRIDRITEKANLKSFTPLWRKNPTQLLRDQVAAGFKALICGIYAHGFNETWLGRPFTEATIQSLAELRRRFGIHPSGEGGEYESLVVNGPIFKQELRLDQASAEWDANSETGIYRVLRAHLERKLKP